MSPARWFYLVAAAIGTVVPWAFFGSFLADEGLDLGAFIEALFVNGPAGGFSADVLISATVFWVWSHADARRLGVEGWWRVVPATLLVGLSLAFPLYLFWRQGVIVSGSTGAAEPSTGSGPLVMPSRT